MSEPQRLLYTFEEASGIANISRAMLRKLARIGEIETVHIGRCVRIPRHVLLRLCGAEPDPKSKSAEGGAEAR